MTMGKKPSKVEKRVNNRWGVRLGCLFVRAANSKAMMSPRIVTIMAASLRVRGIVITGTFRGVMEEVIRSPATILPQARRFKGSITAGLFSLIGEVGLKRGEPNITKCTIRRL